MNFIMAIDQGGTKTDIIIADKHGNIRGYGNDRELLASGEIDSYPVYYKKDRRIVRMLRVRYAAERALENASLKFNDIVKVSASCTGADWEYEYELGIKNLRKTLGIEDVSLYNDCIGALRGGTEIMGRDTAVLCLGTGANCALINREGDVLIYAYYVKNIHQGASAIGSFVFDAVYDAEAGLEPKTLLTQLLLEETGYASVDDLYMHISAGSNEEGEQWEPAYKDYCHLLFKAVKAGDSVAVNYLEKFCQGLARYILLGAKKLAMQEREICLVLSGGVPKSGSLIVDLLKENLEKDLKGISCIQASFEPVVGALLLDYDKVYSGNIPMDIRSRLEKNCKVRNLLRSVLE